MTDARRPSRGGENGSGVGFAIDPFEAEEQISVPGEESKTYGLSFRRKRAPEIVSQSRLQSCLAKFDFVDSKFWTVLTGALRLAASTGGGYLLLAIPAIHEATLVQFLLPFNATIVVGPYVGSSASLAVGLLQGIVIGAVFGFGVSMAFRFVHWVVMAASVFIASLCIGLLPIAPAFRQSITEGFISVVFTYTVYPHSSLWAPVYFVITVVLGLLSGLIAMLIVPSLARRAVSHHLDATGIALNEALQLMIGTLEPNDAMSMDQMGLVAYDEVEILLAQAAKHLSGARAALVHVRWELTSRENVIELDRIIKHLEREPASLRDMARCLRDFYKPCDGGFSAFLAPLIRPTLTAMLIGLQGRITHLTNNEGSRETCRSRVFFCCVRDRASARRRVAIPPCNDAFAHLMAEFERFRWQYFLTCARIDDSDDSSDSGKGDGKQHMQYNPSRGGDDQKQLRKMYGVLFAAFQAAVEHNKYKEDVVPPPKKPPPAADAVKPPLLQRLRPTSCTDISATNVISAIQYAVAITLASMLFLAPLWRPTVGQVPVAAITAIYSFNPNILASKTPVTIGPMFRQAWQRFQGTNAGAIIGTFGVWATGGDKYYNAIAMAIILFFIGIARGEEKRAYSASVTALTVLTIIVGSAGVENLSEFVNFRVLATFLGMSFALITTFLRPHRWMSDEMGHVTGECANKLRTWAAMTCQGLHANGWDYTFMRDLKEQSSAALMAMVAGFNEASTEPQLWRKPFPAYKYRSLVTSLGETFHAIESLDTAVAFAVAKLSGPLYARLRSLIVTLHRTVGTCLESLVSAMGACDVPRDGLHHMTRLSTAERDIHEAMGEAVEWLPTLQGDDVPEVNGVMAFHATVNGALRLLKTCKQLVMATAAVYAADVQLNTLL